MQMMLPARRPDTRVSAALAGEREAWTGILAEHGPRVWSLCRRLSPEPEDAYQEIWEKVHRRLARFDPDRGSFGSWLTAIAHRHLIDRHRRRRVRGEVLQLPEMRDPEPSSEGRAIARERERALEAALERLPEAQRRAVLMHHLAGRPLAEIARDEGVATGTIKSRLHRARARLCILLEEVL